MHRTYVHSISSIACAISGRTPNSEKIIKQLIMEESSQMGLSNTYSLHSLCNKLITDFYYIPIKISYKIHIHLPSNAVIVCYFNDYNL